MTVVFAKNMLSGFRRAKRKHLFSKCKPYSTTSYEHVSILTLGGLFTHFYYIQKEFSFKLDDCGVVVINQPIEAFVIVSSVTRILQLIKKQAFLSVMS